MKKPIIRKKRQSKDFTTKAQRPISSQIINKSGHQEKWGLPGPLNNCIWFTSV